MNPLRPLLFLLTAGFVHSAAAQRPLADFNNEVRNGIREYRREKAQFPAPERHLTKTFALGDTLHSTSSWDMIRMDQTGDTFTTQVRIDRARIRERDQLYVHNSSLEVVLCHSVSGLTPLQVEALADSLQNSVIRLEQCTTGNALNAPQNCASYAFECVLRANGIDPAPFFTWETSLPEESLMPLLDRLMVRLRELPLSKNRNQWVRETRFTQNALYVCHDVSGQAIHLFFYRDGRFWSKNGGILPHVSYDSVLSVLKHYDQTATLGEYILRDL